ncbi:glycosyltransferase family 9 protein [Spongiimicrobium salis]|uniref:glycosyltransferase family 9 protein n=1 Tax=Spongiimicrobium salis TaxID=1667022 RepID=UPI00374DBCB1
MKQKRIFLEILYAFLKNKWCRKLFNPDYGKIKTLEKGKVCIVPGAGNRLGDMIMKNHAIQKIQKHYDLCYAMPKWFYEKHQTLLESHSFVSEYHILPKGIWNRIKFIFKLKRSGIQATIILDDPAIKEVYFYLAGVPIFCGLNEFKSMGWSYFTTHSYNIQKYGIHYTAMAPCVLESLGVQGKNEDFMPFFPFKKEYIGELILQDGVNLGIHIGGASYWQRKWPFEKYLELCQLFLKNYEGNIFLLGGENEFDENEKLRIQLYDRQSDVSRVYNHCGIDLNGFANILSECHLFLGNDSGPMHMATAVNTRVISIFGPSREDLVGPQGYDPNNIVIRKKMDCAPCNTFNCKLPKNQQYSCLTEIEIEEVWQAVQNVIEMEFSDKVMY